MSKQIYKTLTMLYALHFLRFFLLEIGRHNDIVHDRPNGWKTRVGFRFAWVFAKVRADLKFDRI